MNKQFAVGCHKLALICFLLVGNGTTAKSWKQMKEYCKSIKVYPIGNLTLSNTSMACMESMHETSTPLWIGIVKDIYQNKEQGMTFLVINTFSTCQVFFLARMNSKSLVNVNFCLALK